MKTSIFVHDLSIGTCYGFVIYPLQPQSTVTTIAQMSTKGDDIAHELKELGAEIKPQVLSGFNEYHESLVHTKRTRSTARH